MGEDLLQGGIDEEPVDRDPSGHSVVDAIGHHGLLAFMMESGLMNPPTEWDTSLLVDNLHFRRRFSIGSLLRNPSVISKNFESHESTGSTLAKARVAVTSVVAL